MWNENHEWFIIYDDFLYQGKTDLILYQGSHIRRYRFCVNKIITMNHQLADNVMDDNKIVNIAVANEMNNIICLCYNKLLKSYSYYKLTKNMSMKKEFTFKVKIRLISCGLNHQIFVSQNRELLGHGSNQFGQLGFGEIKEIKQVISLAKNVKFAICTDNGTIFIKTNKDIYSCGRNLHTTVGQPGLFWITKFKKIPYFKNIHIINIKCHSTYSLFIDAHQIMYFWGYNKNFRYFEYMLPCILNDCHTIIQIYPSDHQIFCFNEIKQNQIWFHAIGKPTKKISMKNLYKAMECEDPIIDVIPLPNKQICFLQAVI